MPNHSVPTSASSFAEKLQTESNWGYLRPLVTSDELVVTRIKCGGKNRTIAPNPEWEKVIVCISGKQSLKINLNGELAYSGHIDPWSVSIIPSNTEEHINSSSSDAIAIYIRRNTLTRRFTYYDSLKQTTAIEPRINQRDPVIKELAAELLLYHDDISNNSLYADGIAQFVLNRLYNGRPTRESSNTSTTPNFPPALKTVIDYIHSEYQSEIRLEYLAELASISPYQLSQLFRTYLDTSPHKYLMKIRMDHAGKLLCNTSMSVDEIRRETGHNSLQWFSTAFKNQFGVSPSKYRDLT